MGFGGNATPWGISTRIALVGLTVRSRTRDCAQPLLSETFKVGRPFSATNSFEAFTHWKISQRNQCFTSQRTVHQPVVNLERIASRFIPPLKRCVCLAALERSSSGDFGYETGGALGAGGGQRSEDLPSSRAFLGFVTT